MTPSAGEVRVLGQAARHLRRLGLVRKLREPALAFPIFRVGRTVSGLTSGGAGQKVAFRLGPWHLQESELAMRYEKECAAWRMTAHRAAKAGWVELPGSGWWVTPWNLELALHEAKVEHERRWTLAGEALRELVGPMAFQEIPAFLYEHLLEQRLWQQDLKAALRFELLALFPDRGIYELEWAPREMPRLLSWWTQVSDRILPRRTA